MGAQELHRAGDDVIIVFDGAGSTAAAEMSQTAHRFHALFSDVRSLVRGICRFCAKSYGVLEVLQTSRLPMLEDDLGHSSLRAWLLEGRQVITFRRRPRPVLAATISTVRRLSSLSDEVLSAMTVEAELAALHQPLLRFAKLQLRNDSMAEDVVSETFLAILEKPESFEGRSSLRTYATGILKFKIIDVLRKRGREVHVEPLDEQSMDEAMDALFGRDGHWQEPPAAWQQPEKSLEQRQFFETLQACVDRLPAKIGRVFMMREWLDKEVDEICLELDITASNCGVMLYRARMRLRECLDRNWFAGQR